MILKKMRRINIAFLSILPLTAVMLILFRSFFNRHTLETMLFTLIFVTVYGLITQSVNLFLVSRWVRKPLGSLMERDDLLRKTIEMSPEGFVLTDEEGRIIEWNEGQHKITGLKKEDVMNKYYWDIRFSLFLPERKSETSFDKLKLSILEIIETGKSPVLNKIREAEFLTADGYVKNVQIINFVVETKKGFIESIITRDVTELKKALNKIQESDEKLRKTIELSPDGILLTDEEGLIVEWNEGFINLTGLKRNEVLNRPVWDILSMIFLPESKNTENYNLLKFSFIEILKNGKSSALNKIQENDLLAANGEIKRFQTVTFTVKTTKGFIISTIARDITQIVKTRKELAESEEKYRQLATLAPAGILLADTELNCYYANPNWSEITGYGEEKAYGSGWLDLVRIEYKEKQFAEWKNAIEAKGVINIESQFVKSDNSTGWFEATVKSVTDTEGNATGYIIIVSEVTERKKMEEKLLIALNEKDTLLKEIHHRVKNNLQIITSLLNFQLEFVKEEYDREVFHDSISRVKSMALIHEILYKKTDFSNIPFPEYITDLASYLFTTYRVDFRNVALDARVENLDLSINLAIPCGLIINEMITNSLKYAFRGKKDGILTIEFRLENQTDYILLVRDNGPGINPGLEIKDFNSLGIKLVQDLTRQLQGRLEFIRENGFGVKIKFKKE